LYFGVLRIVIKNNIIIDLRTKILFGKCFSHYLEYCFHVLFYYYYYFSIKHQNNPSPQNPPLAIVTHPANPTQQHQIKHVPTGKLPKIFNPTTVKLRNLHQTHYEPPKKPATNREPPHPKTHNNPNTTSHRYKPINTKHNKPTKQQKNSQKIHNLLGRWGSRSWWGEREARFGSRRSPSQDDADRNQMGLQICSATPLPSQSTITTAVTWLGLN
jgi:hypothetical protein